MISRRNLMAASAFAVLPACTVPTTVAAWATDAAALATGLSNLVPQLSTIAAIPADAQAAASTALTAATALAKQLSTTAIATAGASLLSQIEGYVNAVFASLQPYFSLLPAPFSTALTAVNLLLPFIEAALGMVSTTPTARAPVLVKVPAPSTAPAGMTSQQVHDWAVSVLTGK